MSYTPGEKGRAVAKSIRPSMAVELAFEHGFYEGDYVVADAKQPFHPDMEQIRQAAQIKWPNQVVAFEDIAEWAGEGALDYISGSFRMGNSPLNPQRRAVLLVNNGLFERKWSST